MNHQVDVFSRLPSEVIQHIAITACSLTLTGPPSELVPLLQLGRGIHAALCIRDNPGLYARIFRLKFDWQAPTRRYADAGQPLTARNFAHELQRRWVVLKRIRDASNMGGLLACSEDQEIENAWMIYLMFLESDGLNWEQLLWAQVSKYGRTVISEKIASLQKPGFMLETTIRALGLWIMWFLTEVHIVVLEESPQQLSYMYSILRPWALATHKYDPLCAPYSHRALPIPDEPDLGEDPLFVTAQQSLADLDLRNRSEVVTHMGRRIQLAPPRAAAAAIMALMVRLERHGPLPVHPTPHMPNAPRPTGLSVYPRTRYPAFNGPGSNEFDGVICKGSAAYDIEWRRILQCGNPFAVPKFKSMPLIRPGELVGRWEGRTVFPSLDSFRDMLAGVVGAVTDGFTSQQPHVWNIQEHHLVSRRRRIPFGQESSLITGEKLPYGNDLDAWIPHGSEFIHHGEPGARYLEVRVPDEAHGYKSYNYVTLDRPVDPPPRRIPTTRVLPIAPPAPSDDMDLSPDQEPPRLSRPGDGDDQFEETVLDTLITGEGYASRGSFKLYGRIRAWDGMITLVKLDNGFAQDRGRWLYRGYVGSGGNWSGRWRETFTPVHLNGYEGIFSFTRQHQL
ncbi:hypothetical protein RSOLAG22IIIB_10320 [Rhizoctonia solani]|uniref:Uncharacterized protein n=1 Tax=Rhizoctonia solani TaxID=456999 RepID=A0A0K6G3J1_9AGAM|nr:hypothetical protein RSOLAG22IIIB_10320 [Rhizoctonia solani]